MKKIIMVLFIVLTVVSLGACKSDNKQDKAKDKNTASKVAEQKNYTVIYLAKMEKPVDGDVAPPTADCDKNLVEIKLDGKLSPRQTLEKLLSYKVSDENQGVFNAFASAKNLKIEDMLVKNNFVIVKLSGELKVEDMCSERQIYNQIKKTLVQFDDIAGADIFMNGQEFSQYLATLREQNDANVK